MEKVVVGKSRVVSNRVFLEVEARLALSNVDIENWDPTTLDQGDEI